LALVFRAILAGLLFAVPFVLVPCCRADSRGPRERGDPQRRYHDDHSIRRRRRSMNATKHQETALERVLIESWPTLAGSTA
jgi:hypothetical protein